MDELERREGWTLEGFPMVAEEKVKLSERNLVIADTKAIINPETNEVFGIASKQYKLVKHEDVCTSIEEVIGKYPEFGPSTRMLSFDKAGGRMRARYIFKETQVPVAKLKGDLISPSIEVFNSYDLTWRHQVLFGAFRLVCSNGMVVGETMMKFKKRHMPDLYLEDVKQALQKGMGNLSEQTELWKQWVDKVLSYEKEDEVLDAMDLNGKETTTLKALPETTTGQTLNTWEPQALIESDKAKEMTWWVFFNIITQFLTHHIKSEVRRVQLEGRLRKVMY